MGAENGLDSSTGLFFLIDLVLEVVTLERVYSEANKIDSIMDYLSCKAARRC